jgi:hypothetical protein
MHAELLSAPDRFASRFLFDITSFHFQFFTVSSVTAIMLLNDHLRNRVRNNERAY